MGPVQESPASSLRRPDPATCVKPPKVYSLNRALTVDCSNPDVLPANQVYIVILLAHGGVDLESFKLKSWVEAASVLWQVAAVCARAEAAVQFEVSSAISGTCRM